jgi:hypothetical protein
MRARTFHQLTLFFEGVGVLVQKDLINIDLVERLFSDRIIWFWGEATHLILQGAPGTQAVLELRVAVR